MADTVILRPFLKCSALFSFNYACSIYAIPFGSEDEVNWDSRPYVVGNFKGINVYPGKREKWKGGSGYYGLK